jgi:3-oxoacyl-[acyl-carrier protein] reductase
MSNLKDKVLYITGAGRGLGKAITERFLEEGAFVCAFEINEENLQSSVAEWDAGERVLPYLGDVRNRTQIQASVDQCVAEYGRIDVLANVAGIAQEDNFLEIDAKDWQRIQDVNLTGVFNVAQLVARQMAKQKSGSIINMASKNGVRAEVKYGHYNATKAGVILLTQTMALELAPHNIRVNSVAPGYILTPLAEEIDSKHFMEFYRERCIPMGRLGTPEDVAGAFAFLGGDDSKFVTGHTLVVDGGQIAHDGRKIGAYETK